MPLSFESGPSSNEIAPSQARIVNIRGEEIAMFNIEGTFFALQNAGTQRSPRGASRPHSPSHRSRPRSIRWHDDSSTTKRCCSTPIAPSSRRLTMEARSPRRPQWLKIQPGPPPNLCRVGLRETISPPPPLFFLKSSFVRERTRGPLVALYHRAAL
jgi:hypothetical protein